METYEQMLKRHNKEVVDFQTRCPHNNKHIHEYVHGPLMHGGGYEDWCEDCGKLLAVYKTPMVNVEFKPNCFRFEKSGGEVRIEADKLDEWRETHTNDNVIWS